MTATLNQSLNLSDCVRSIASMHPWRELRDQWPEWQVRFALLDGIAGCTDVERRTIWLDKRLNQAERRSTLAHEAIHAARGDTECDERDELDVEQAAARILLPLDRLLHVLPWATSYHEAADELWVDPALLRCRLNHLHPSERGAIKRAFAARDNTEET